MVQVNFILKGPRPWNSFWNHVKVTFNTHHDIDYLIEHFVKRDLVSLIPMKSGYLMDNIFSTLYVRRTIGITSGPNAGGFALHMHPFYPSDRPTIFSTQVRVQHTPPDKGYAPFHTIKDAMVHPRFLEMTTFRKSKAGTYWSSGRSAIYELDDPIAERDVLRNVARAIERWLMIGMRMFFENYKTVQWNIDIGAV